MITRHSSRARTTLARVALPALMLSVLASGSARAQEKDSTAFTFNEKLAAGSWIRVQNMNGNVDVVASTGTNVEVIAEKRWDRGNPRDVRFEVLRDEGNVTICALWDNDRQDSSCTATSYRANNNSGKNNDVEVYFTIKLPKGIKVSANTVNGDVDVDGAGTQTHASSVNGEVRVTTLAGPVSASSVNGSVDVDMATIVGTEAMDFKSINGNVVLRVPDAFDAELTMSTVNGNVRSDFPLTLEGRIDPRRIRGVIGSGGRKLRVSTVNGNLEIRKR